MIPCDKCGKDCTCEIEMVEVDSLDCEGCVYNVDEDDCTQEKDCVDSDSMTAYIFQRVSQ